MVIVCDIDNIVNNLSEELIRRYNERMGTSLTQDDFTEYEFDKTLPPEGVEYMYELLRQKDVWDSLVPLEDSVWAIDTLVRVGHTVLFATATEPCNFPWKVEWMQKYFPFVNSNNIIRIMDKGHIRTDVIIDDDLKQLKSNPCERICLSYPWNVNDRVDYVYDIYRCNTWRDIINKINTIEGKNA